MMRDSRGVTVAIAPPSLAAVLIVRDEARCIARCLASLAPWVDRLVVLDTNSTDDTVALATAAGATVHRFDWCDDFAAARNRALDLADADWNLVVDADETLVEGGASLRAWCRDEARLGTVRIDSETDGGAVSHSWITRLLPRGVRYAGRVHEQPVATVARARTGLVLAHDGYAPARRPAKSARNRPLLLAALAEAPGDGYLLFQLGRDAEGDGRAADAADWYGRALAATPATANWRHELVVGAVGSLGRAGRPADGLALAQAEMAAWSDSPDFFFALGDCALDQAIADPARAIADWLPLARTAWQRCLAIGERPDLEGSVAGRGSHLARHNLALLDGQG